MGPAGQREQGRASGACALRACLSGLTVGPGGEARERARGLRSGASGDRWLDWAGAGRGWAAREWARGEPVGPGERRERGRSGPVLGCFWLRVGLGFSWVLGFLSFFFFYFLFLSKFKQKQLIEFKLI